MMAALHRSSVNRGGRTMGGAKGALYQPRNEPKIRTTILVVDDEVLVRMMIADQLRSAGYTVVEASNAQEALDVLHHSFDVKLVLSDIRMPGSMDGADFARLVRSEYPLVKIVLTSGDLATVDRAEHDGFFAKPYDVSKILAHIETLLD
jgi:CheY-like chemotaxis protein